MAYPERLTRGARLRPSFRPGRLASGQPPPGLRHRGSRQAGQERAAEHEVGRCHLADVPAVSRRLAVTSSVISSAHGRRAPGSRRRPWRSAAGGGFGHCLPLRRSDSAGEPFPDPLRVRGQERLPERPGPGPPEPSRGGRPAGRHHDRADPRRPSRGQDPRGHPARRRSCRLPRPRDDAGPRRSCPAPRACCRGPGCRRVTQPRRAQGKEPRQATAGTAMRSRRSRAARRCGRHHPSTPSTCEIY